MYCKYCKIPEDKIFKPCLKCEKCNKLVHTNCLKRKSTPGGIVGDVFFDFTCLECNNGSEELFNRSKMPWFQALTLVLFDIMHKSEGTGRHGFFHWKIHVNSYIEKHWHILFRKDFKRKKNWIGTVSGTLSIYSPLFFTSGTEILGEGGWWKLTYPNLSPEIIVQLCSELTQIKHQNKESKHTSNIQKDIEILNKILLEKYSYVRPKINTSNSDLVPDNAPKRFKYDDEANTDDSSSQENNQMFNLLPPLDDDDFNLTIDDEVYDLGFENFDFSNQPLFNDLIEDTKKLQTNNDNQLIEHESETNRISTTEPPVHLKSLFNTNNNVNSRPWEDTESTNFCTKFSDNILPLTVYEENELFKKLNNNKTLSPQLRRILTKLRLRKIKRERNIKVFNIDKIYEELSKNPNKKLEFNKNETIDQYYLDRYHNAIMLTKSKISQESVIPFHLRLIGYNEPKAFLSPYTNRMLKPYIRRDSEITSVRKPVWLKLMDELKMKVQSKNPTMETEVISNAPIDYCYVRPEHIPAINLLCELYFWPGIDMTESLRYPDFSCVVLYKKIVIGFAFMIPDVAYNESYISFIFTRPEWRRTGIATFMLYHLVQTCMGKEVTLHVSATNPAVILYQKFGFKVEEFIQDFYEKYMVDTSRECKHALFLRLGR